jgi:hypothetical protein
MIKQYVYLTRDDILRGGDFSKPIALDRYPGTWWIWERPIIDWWGRIKPVLALSEMQNRLT